MGSKPIILAPISKAILSASSQVAAPVKLTSTTFTKKFMPSFTTKSSFFEGMENPFLGQRSPLNHNSFGSAGEGGDKTGCGAKDGVATGCGERTSGITDAGCTSLSFCRNIKNAMPPTRIAIIIMVITIDFLMALFLE